MADVVVEQKHAVGVDEARQRVNSFEEMLQKYGVKTEWKGPNATFKGTGVAGGIEVTASLVRVTVKLGLLAKAAGVDGTKLKGSIEKRLKAAFEPTA